MKKITFSLVIALFSAVILQAQEKNIQKETVTKTITVNGSTTTTTKTTKEEKQVIEINDSGVENQNEKYSSKKNEVSSETKTVVKENPQNDAAIAEIKRKQKEEIEASKKAQLALYETEKLELEKKAAEDKKRKSDSIKRVNN